jgi:hypothetical protein
MRLDLASTLLAFGRVRLKAYRHVLRCNNPATRLDAPQDTLTRYFGLLAGLCERWAA